MMDKNNTRLWRLSLLNIDRLYDLDKEDFMSVPYEPKDTDYLR